MDCLLKLSFSKTSFRNTIRVSNSLDPDQARQKVGPDLGPNCLQRSADDKSTLVGKDLKEWIHFQGGWGGGGGVGGVVTVKITLGAILKRGLLQKEFFCFSMDPFFR